MTDQAHENLVELLRRFMDEPAARAAQEDIRAGERFLDACPAPAPEARLLATIKAQVAAAAQRRRRLVRLTHRSLAAAAAIVVLALIGLFGPGPSHRPRISHVALIPPAVWDSHDIAADDLDLVYFSAQLGQIEAQAQALDAGESEGGSGSVDEFEEELMAIQADFWKG
jgi:hypothetical protein